MLLVSAAASLGKAVSFHFDSYFLILMWQGAEEPVLTAQGLTSWKWQDFPGHAPLLGV